MPPQRRGKEKAHSEVAQRSRRLESEEELRKKAPQIWVKWRHREEELRKREGDEFRVFHGSYEYMTHIPVIVNPQWLSALFILYFFMTFF